jgi:peptidoglycan/LPS O-acetylase OafA/YrhL
MTKKTIPYYGAEPADSITSYKPFIDGLRALAVVSVVFFHVGLNAVRGGFVGVDIFFVISGFLIINTIREGLHDGGFSFGDFWSRRALRILPPYLLVIVASALVAPFVLVLPVEYTQFAQEVGTSSVFLINHLFLVQQGYFDLNSDLKVLLHLWSLAVEEQFYIVAPLLLWVLWKLPAKISGAIVAAIFAVSLLGCIAYTTGGQNLAFYVMPFRAWEFVAGGAIGLFVVAAKRLPKIVLELIAIAGVAAIICAVTLFSKKTPFPSYYAALPVFGCSAIILAGLANARIIVARILALPPFVAVGLISYSWYLWHWPLLTLARIHDFGSYNLNRDYVLAAVSFALATGTYLFIERPIRLNRKRFLISSWRPAIIGLLVCCSALPAGEDFRPTLIVSKPASRLRCSEPKH